jgi:hypothetical protein
MMKHLPLLLALALVLLGPVALRPRQENAPRPGERALVIITPHSEAIRSEFGRAFAAQYLAKTGQRVRVDWRAPGGTSEIARYVASEYLASFQNHWTGTLRNRGMLRSAAASTTRKWRSTTRRRTTPSNSRRGALFSLRT